MNQIVTHPFTKLTDGKYFYMREGFARPTPIDVEVRGGSFFVRFPHNLTPVKLSALPFDATLTPMTPRD